MREPAVVRPAYETQATAADLLDRIEDPVPRPAGVEPG